MNTDISQKINACGLSLALCMTLVPNLAISAIHHHFLADVRQGGDTLESAVLIDALPFTDSGTTMGFNADYPLYCVVEMPGPDVVYEFTPTTDLLLTVDLCGSGYDTALFIYGPNWDPVACSNSYYQYDPDCGAGVSRVDAAPLIAEIAYHIIIGGAGGASGDYLLDAYEYHPCAITPPGDAVAEGEPALVDGYLDAHNGGCAFPQFGYPFQSLEGDAGGHCVLAGAGGWFDDGAGSDRDWFEAVIGESGIVEIDFTTEIRSWLIRAAPADCASVAVAGMWVADDCASTTAEIAGAPGEIIWFVVRVAHTQPHPGWEGNEFGYLLEIDGLSPAPVAVVDRSWTSVKSLFE